MTTIHAAQNGRAEGTRAAARRRGPAHRSQTRTSPRARRVLKATALLAPAILTVGLLPATAAGPNSSDQQPLPRFGSSVSRTDGEDYPEAKTRITRDYGKPGVMRIYNSGLPSSWDSIHANLGHNAPFVVSFKAPPSEVLSGDLDSYFTNWFAQAPVKRRTFWSYYHEPEDDIARGEFTAADYRAAWAHLADLARSAGNRHLRPTLILMTWSLNPASGRDWHDYYAAGSVKILGWDGYNPYEAQGRYAPPREMFQRAYAAARSVDLPWGIAEFGSELSAGDSGAERAKWLAACASYLRKRDVRFVTYFDAVFVGENDFRLLDPPSRDAWRSAVTSGNSTS